MKDAASQEVFTDWQLTQIRLEDLCLVELRHVSKGAWQPVLSRM